jgi:phosphoribosylformylglycinamidine cyclo-ligase
VPKGFYINIDWKAWKQPSIFKLIQETGRISDDEMRNVFNLGIGLIAIVNRKDVLSISSYLKKHNEKHFIIGNLTN